ncbi:MAG: zf-TFIIB domain-containing protein [Alphaproteobacteria bacterium]|nr:zf-TFIIB domain-containing protein [Alphaproteobacteria bacterium SS10]
MTKQNTDHRPCPIDGAGMEHFDRFGVAVDICPLCEGVWLDAGELQMIISLAACYLVHEAAAEAEAIRTKPIPMGASPRSGKNRLSPQQQAIADRNFVEALTQRSRHREKGVYELNLATSTPFSVRRQLKQQEQEMQSLRRGRLKKGSSLASHAFTAYETADGAGEAYDMLSSIFEALQ